MICNNCRKTLGCGCQKRTASNGTPCCTSCVTAYETKIKKIIPTSTQPTNVSVIYTPPKK